MPQALNQIAGVFRLELKKTFLSRRGWWIYFLAAGPVAITVLHWLVEQRDSIRAGTAWATTAMVFAGMFQFFYLRGAHLLRLRGHLLQSVPRRDARKDAALLLS